MKDYVRNIRRLTQEINILAVLITISLVLVTKFIFLPSAYVLYGFQSYIPLMALLSIFTLWRWRVRKDLFRPKEQSLSIKKEKVLIFDAGKASMQLREAMVNNSLLHYEFAGFLQLKPGEIANNIPKKELCALNRLASYHKSEGICKLLVPAEHLAGEDWKVAARQSLTLGIKVLTVHGMKNDSAEGIKEWKLEALSIEDLLRAKPVIRDQERLSAELYGRRVLVSGAAGSIGSELVRQLLRFKPGMLILCDQAETPLYNLQLEIEEKFPTARLVICMADVRDYIRMSKLFEKYKPQLVFHTAACKHVPLMQTNPGEAVLTNVSGTRNLADIAMACGVEKFVMTSTDKAVNPCSIMGASKRMAEIYLQSLQNNAVHTNRKGILQQTRFMTTRFGNVLNSNGSVIPRFRNQIRKGGALTITHPEVTRYFMSIQEAVELVLQAGAMGKGGEIFTFNMGEAIKIKEMAETMIRLAGHEPGVDIGLVYAGLRPGEKMHEELLNSGEFYINSEHPDIMIAKGKEYCYKEVSQIIDEVVAFSREEDEFNMIRKIRELVPDFIPDKVIAEDQDTNL